MTDATERIRKLYGPPISPEQIKMYFETYINTYIDSVNQYPIENRLSFILFSYRPIKFLFFLDSTTVYYSLIGKSNKEGAYSVNDISLLTGNSKNGEILINSGTSLNGQFLYSTANAISDAKNKFNEELTNIEIPVIKDNLHITKNELEKKNPNLDIIRKTNDNLCQSLQSIENFNSHDNELLLFQSNNFCPFLIEFKNNYQNIEREIKFIKEDITNTKKTCNSKSDLTQEAINLLKEYQTRKKTDSSNKLQKISTIFAIIFGVSSLLLTILVNFIFK